MKVNSKLYNRIFTLVFILIINPLLGIAQAFKQIHHFNTSSGLPSNLIYELQQDKIGNLWICTDNGVSRLDGKYFRNYNYKDGLPSNDVVACRVANDGTVWLNCFGYKPTYFANDAFYLLPTDEKRGVENVNYLLSSNCNNDVVYNFGNPRIEVIIKSVNNYKAIKKEKSIIKDTTVINNNFFFEYSYLDSVYTFYKTKEGCIIDSKAIKKNNIAFVDNSGYYHTKNNYLKEIIVNASNKIVEHDFLANGQITKPCFFKDYIILVDNSAMVYIYDRVSKKLLDKVQAQQGALCALLDQYNQLWVGTKNNGLYCYAKSKVSTYLTNTKNSQFSSIYVADNTTIFAGNIFSQVHQITTTNQRCISFPKSERGGNIKSFLNQNNTLYFLEDNFIGWANKVEKLKFITNHHQIKCGLVVNDSIFFIGSVGGAFFFNTNSKSIQPVNPKQPVRIYACAINKKDWVYYKHDHLIYKVHYPGNKVQMLPIRFAENELITSMVCTKEDLLWVATNHSKIYILQQDKVIDSIVSAANMLQNITHIASNANTVVVSSKSGIAVIDYTFNEKLIYNIRYVSQQDGLPSNAINQSFITNDSIYCATDNGIAVISKNFSNANYSINPTVQAMQINNKLMPIKTNYSLPSAAYSVMMQVGGVDISGHLNHMQYAINDTINWSTLDNNQLSLLLQGGPTKVYTRYVDNQNIAGSAKLACVFDVAIPFYKTPWFLVLSSLFFAGALSYYFYRNKIAKQKIIWDKQLALKTQQQKITADLHDDIGATLSSLQLNSTIAKKWMIKDPTKTEGILGVIERQAKELSEKIGDIIWSMKAEQEAFGSFSDRVKTFANQILDYSNIHYTISIDDAVDKHINTSVLRKNMILIAKETINNAAKYSNAAEINIKCSIINNNIHYQITDDGIGFDAQKITGNGLQNIKNRVAELGGQCLINSQNFKGTHIQISIPITKMA
jgi:signal transduction histidine kinase